MPSRVGGRRRIERPKANDRLRSRPSSNRACDFPAHGFPSVVRRWACAARQEPAWKIQETFGADSRETRPSPLRHFASQHRHKCPPLAPRGLCSPTDPRYDGATMEDSDFSGYPKGLAGPARLRPRLSLVSFRVHGRRSPSLSCGHFQTCRPR